MTLSELSIRRPVFAWMLMFALIIFGAIGFLRMGVSFLPDVDFPVVTVSTTLEGAAPEIMETDIIDPIEDAIMTVEGVRTVSSSARNGTATTTIEFDLNKNIDIAVQEVQNKLAQTARLLPREMDPAVITKTNPEDQPILWLALTSDRHSRKDIMLYVKDHLKDQLSTVSGVGDLILGGYVDPNLRVWVDNTKLNQYSLSVGDLISTIQNEHSELPAGRIETSTKEYNVRTLGEAKSPEQFGDIVIGTRGGQPNYTPIRIHQVATVEEGLADVRRISRSQGKSSVGLGIRKQRGSNAVDVAREVHRKVTEVAKHLPEGMQLNPVFDSTRFIEEAVGELNFTLLLSAILTAIVCWGFLGSLSSTFNVVLAIPTSIVGTFIILYWAGFTLNTFTILGLSLAIGIVVDDAIMVLENIVRHQEMGKPKEQAALDGSREITFAAMAATVAIVAIFLPVAFMKGAIGKFFFQFGVTMTAAVLLSLLEALTLTPMRCAKFVEVHERTTRIGRAIEYALEKSRLVYQRLLVTSLAHPWKITAASLAFFAVSITSVKWINKEMIPPQDQSRFLMRLQTPVGSSLSFTDERFKEAEVFLKSRPEIERYFLAVGGFGGGEVNTGNIFVTLKPVSERKMSQFEIMASFRKELSKLKDVKVVVMDLSSRGFFGAGRGFPVEFTVRGPDWEKLADYAVQIMEGLKKTGLVTDVDTDYQTGMPEVEVYPDRVKAAQRGVSVNAIGQTVNAMIGGVLVGKYPKGGHRYDIRVRLREGMRDRADDVKHLFVRNNRGELIRLSDVVHIEEKPTLQVISRQDRERAISIFANVAPGKSQAAALEAVEKLSHEILPQGYRAVLMGGSQGFKESMQSLLFAFVLGVIVAYMILASQFNSFVDPITVLMALPFSISGAFMALFVSRQSINIYSVIGLILLMGIVKKNSILLVDFTNQVREKGKNVRDALLEACPMRLRPIVMTSFATIAGALPAALAIGPGAETRVPMAIAVIGGVLVSTVLTLFVVPCVYLLFSKLERRERQTHAEAPNPKHPTIAPEGIA